MPTRSELTTSEREFFFLVSSAAFVNPFSDERVEIDLKIAGASGETTPERRVALLIPKITQRLTEFESSGRADVSVYTGDDREMVETVFLFDVYHRYLDDFDRLIHDQMEAGDEPCPVPFAKKALQELR